MTPKAVQIASSIVTIWATALGLYCLTSGRWTFAAITAAAVGVNLWIASNTASEG